MYSSECAAGARAHLGALMQADMELIKQRLFEKRDEIIADYNLGLADTPDELARKVLHSLDQQPSATPLELHHDNNAVFRAAVRAIGSNSKKWVTYLKNEKELARQLSGFDAGAVQQNAPHSSDLAKLLPGVTARADANAIVQWSKILSERKNYYVAIIAAARVIQAKYSDLHNQSMPMNELFLCVVAHFTDGTPKAAARKWPGMGFALGAEFLRNFGWNGFKPDRHIKRLLEHWKKGQIDVQPQLKHLITLIGSSGAELKENLSCSLTGISIAPNDYENNLSHFDNLIWLLGAYVEKKDKETDLPYVIA